MKISNDQILALAFKEFFRGVQLANKSGLAPCYMASGEVRAWGLVPDHLRDRVEFFSQSRVPVAASGEAFTLSYETRVHALDLVKLQSPDGVVAVVYVEPGARAHHWIPGGGT